MLASSTGSGHLMSPREHVERIRRDRFYIGRDEKNPLAEDIHQAVNYLSEELYSKDVHFLMELIQNAEDNEYSSSGAAPSLEFVLTSEDITATGANSTLLIFNNEKGFSATNIESICRVGKSTKKGQRYRGYIGEKGIGFKSVFLVSSQPHIFSNGYQIKFNEEPSPECEIGYIVPEWVDEHPTVCDLKAIYGSAKVLPTTTIILPLKEAKVPAVRKQLSSFHPELLLFLSKIRKLSVKEIGENNSKHSPALTEVSISSEKDYETRKNVDAESYTLHLDANEAGSEAQCTYYMWKQKFPVRQECRVKKREEVEQWTITLAFPHGQRLGGAQIQSPGIYAFLPTEMVTNFPFVIQADFLLASSRESILQDSPWNKGILECVPSAFIEALVAQVKPTSDAPAFSLPPMFKFLPVRESPWQLLNDSVRTSIKSKVLEKDIIPCQSYNKQMIFCKPGEVRRLTPQFWNLLDEAQKSGVDLQSISSHGHCVLSSPFDTKAYDDVLGFMGIGYMDWGWYPKCIEGTDIVKKAPEEVYMMLLCFVAEQWLELGSKIQQTAILKYEDVNGRLSICSINRATTGSFRLCIASDENIIPWLSSWNRELAYVSNQFFMPRNTQQCLKGFCKRTTVMDWLQTQGKLEVLTVYKYVHAVSRAVITDRSRAIMFAHFLYHSWQKRYISESSAKEICNSMPVVDNYGSVITERRHVLVPANGSKWAGLMCINPWRSENYVELSGDYREPANYAGNLTSEKVLLTFIQDNVGAADVPFVRPPNASLPTVASQLTKENALLLLEWIRNLSSGGCMLPSKFLDCVKSGSWLKTSIGYKAPKDSFLSREMWANFLQTGSDMVDIPMIDQEFYNNEISNYKNELRLIGVKFEFNEASELIGKSLMARVANGTFTPSSLLSLLGLIRFLRDKNLSPSHLIDAVKNDRWLKTCNGNKSPNEAYLYSSEWNAISCLANLPFIDENVYGKSILGYKVELELLGVHVRLADVSNYFQVVVDNLKFPPNLSTPQALLLLLKCICHVGVVESYLEKIKHIIAIKTNLGFRMPSESVLPVAEWDSVYTAVDGIPLLDVQFYGEGEIRSYSEALRKLGVAVRSEEVSKVVSLRFKQLVSSLSFQKSKAISVLECLRQLKGNQNMLPPDLVACMKKEKWVQTKMGLRAPTESILFNAEWDSISSIASVPFIEYSGDVEEYKNELRDLGVAVTLKQGAGFVLKGINLPTDPTTIDPSSFLMLLKCIMYWNERKSELPGHFMDCLKLKKKWVKTVLGYRNPDESLLFDAKYSSLIERGDGPFIDDEFYGSEIAQYKDQLKEIGVEVDISDGCCLVARHLKTHTEGRTITRIYKFLQKFQWKPENRNSSWIWIPSEHGEGNWVCPNKCVLHDNSKLFASQLHILDKFYEEDLLGFFYVAFDVKDVPDVEEYMNLWELWENSASQVPLDDCLAFWENIGVCWYPNCEKLLIKKLPVLINGGISLVSKQDVFIPDDLLLEDLFDESLFVWYPARSVHSLPRSKLTRVYTSLGVRKFSEAVEKHETFASSENGTLAVRSNTVVVKEGLLTIILAFLANPTLDISDKERHEMVGSLFDLTIIEADEPVHMEYKITLSGGRQLEAKTTPLFRWERNESRLLMLRVHEVQGMEGRIKYATYLADEISRGLLHDRADLVESLAELIKVGYLLDYDMAAVRFLLKNNNLRVFSEDEEFLLLHINKALPTQS